MRIAFTHAFCWPEVRRGAERYIQELGAALARRGHDVTILSSGWEPVTDELDGVTTVRLRRRRQHQLGHEADFGRRVLPRLVRGRYDVVHAMGRRDAVAAVRAAPFAGHRTAMTDLGLPSRAFWDTMGKEARFVERAVRDIDVYGCMSRYALDFLARDYGRTDGHVLPGGVDLDEFRPAEARHPTPVLLFSGAITEPRKGVATVLAALPRIAEVHPDVELWLSGPGDPAELLAAAPPEARERTTPLGTGDAADQPRRYGTAWTTVLPSTDDSFGMALIESLACGTPLTVSTHGAPQELVDDGVTGARCEPGDAESFATACLRVLELTQKPGTAAACRAMAERFGWDAALAPQAEALYEDARGRPPRRRARPSA